MYFHLHSSLGFTISFQTFFLNVYLLNLILALVKIHFRIFLSLLQHYHIIINTMKSSVYILSSPCLPIYFRFPDLGLLGQHGCHFLTGFPYMLYHFCCQEQCMPTPASLNLPPLGNQHLAFWGCCCCCRFNDYKLPCFSLCFLNGFIHSYRKY